MNKLTSLFLVSSLLILSSCNFFENCVEPEGNAIMNELDLEVIRSVELKSSVNLIISQGPKQIIEVNAPQNYFDLLNKDVEDGNWEISFDRCVNGGQQIDMFIVLTDLTELEISGSGNVMSEGIFHGEELELDINGSGSMQMELNYKDVEVGIQGSGAIKLMGESKELDIEINGSGNVDAEQLITDACEVKTNGSGDARINVSHELNIEGNGSGNVYYKGQPSEINSKFNGSGELYQIE